MSGRRRTRTLRSMGPRPATLRAREAVLEWATVATVCETSFSYNAFRDTGGGEYLVSLCIQVTREADEDEIAEEKSRLAAAAPARDVDCVKMQSEGYGGAR